MQNIIQRSKLDVIEMDDLSDIVGVKKREMSEVLYQLQKDGLLKFEDDISVFIKKSVKKEFEKHFETEERVFKEFKISKEYEKSVNLRLLNEEGDNQVPLFRQIIQSWVLLSKIKVDSNDLSATFKKDYCVLKCKDLDRLERLIKARRKLSEFIVTKLLQKIGGNKKGSLNTLSSVSKCFSNSFLTDFLIKTLISSSNFNSPSFCNWYKTSNISLFLTSRNLK
jgi:ATP-dependent DNA helicase RecQ